MANIEYEVGDVIEYVAHGSVSTRRVRVLRRVPDLNGRPGFDGKYEGLGIRGEHIPPGEVWGYDHQIIRNVSRARRERG